MVAWVGMFGRIIRFMLEKIASRRIELTLDDRRKAVRQFLTLYYAVTDLELLAKELMAELRDMIELKDPTIASEWLRNISLAVDETSQRFLEATQGLRAILEIFDPVLALTLSDMEANKLSFLLLASQ